MSIQTASQVSFLSGPFGGVDRIPVARKIEKNATRLLESHPHFHGRSNCIRCRCSERCLYLNGIVPSFYVKQIAQEALRELDGVERIENRIVVASPRGEIRPPDSTADDSRHKKRAGSKKPR